MDKPMDQARRDGLGRFCFWLHVAVFLFIALGWALRPMLLFYLIFLPLVVLHWRLNRGACLLNNVENWLRHRRWRAPAQNPEEGAWLRTLIASTLGVALSAPAMNRLIYSAMALFWLLALAH